MLISLTVAKINNNNKIIYKIIPALNATGLKLRLCSLKIIEGCNFAVTGHGFSTFGAHTPSISEQSVPVLIISQICKIVNRLIDRREKVIGGSPNNVFANREHGAANFICGFQAITW